jgi:hypothetical protein
MNTSRSFSSSSSPPSQESIFPFSSPALVLLFYFFFSPPSDIRDALSSYGFIVLCFYWRQCCEVARSQDNAPITSMDRHQGWRTALNCRISLDTPTNRRRGHRIDSSLSLLPYPSSGASTSSSSALEHYSAM